MLSKLIGAILIGLVAYGVVSCEVSDREKKRIKDDSKNTDNDFKQFHT